MEGLPNTSESLHRRCSSGRRRDVEQADLHKVTGPGRRHLIATAMKTQRTAALGCLTRSGSNWQGIVHSSRVTGPQETTGPASSCQGPMGIHWVARPSSPPGSASPRTPRSPDLMAPSFACRLGLRPRHRDPPAGSCEVAPMHAEGPAIRPAAQGCRPTQAATSSSTSWSICSTIDQSRANWAVPRISTDCSSISGLKPCLAEYNLAKIECQ